MMSWVSFPLDGLAWSGAEPSWHNTWPDSKRGFCPYCVASGTRGQVRCVSRMGTVPRPELEPICTELAARWPRSVGFSMRRLYRKSTACTKGTFAEQQPGLTVRYKRQTPPTRRRRRPAAALSLTVVMR